MKLSGEADLSPLIHKAVELVKDTKRYHLLVLITTGQLQEESLQATKTAIIEASHYPLSILIIGVGDGPFTLLQGQTYLSFYQSLYFFFHI